MTEADAIQTLLYGSAVLVFYGALRWRLIAFTQDLRVEAGKAALDLLEDERLTSRQRQLLVGGIRRAFSREWPWVMALGMFIAPYVSQRSNPELLSASPDLNQRFKKTMMRLVICNVATSPAAFSLFLVALVVAFFVLSSIASLQDAIGRVMTWTNHQHRHS